MFPKYQLLTDYFHISNEELYKHLFNEMKNTYPDIDLNQYVDDYCYEKHLDSCYTCVVNDVGTKYNKNGITFLEEYCAPQLDSIKDMSVTVEFLNEEKTIISGHGLTGIEDGMPVFDDASVIGHFTEGYIDNVDTDDGTKRVVIGKGYLDEMRYHSFVEQLESDLSDGVSIEGSIEIYKAKGNKGIIYKNGNPKETGRIPTSFIHSGWTMVSNPSDPTSVLIELNEKNNKEDKETMEFNMEDIKNTISATISELNDN